MEFPKPPPLKTKPACPVVAAKWYGADRRLVRIAILVSVPFWILVLAGPVALVLILVWHLLQGLVLAKLVALFVLATAIYVGYGLGMGVASRIVRYGLAPDKKSGSIQKKQRI